MSTTSERLREHFSAAMADDPAVEALVVEAARIADRLDNIDGIITGKSEWIKLMHFRVRNEDKQRVEVVLDGVLSEGRQQAVALKAILAQLGVGKANLSGASKAGDLVDEIAKRRAARGAGSASSKRHPAAH